MRMKSKWHKNANKGIEDIGSVVATTIWKLASTTANKLYATGYNFSSNQQILEVIGEMTALMVQSSADLAHDSVNQEDFLRFVNTVAKKLAATMESNLREEVGPGEYAAGYIEMLNSRLADFSEFRFSGGDPSYHALRYFGRQVEAVMQQNDTEDNKWIIEQIMEADAPPMLKKLIKAVKELFEQYNAQTDTQQESQ